MLDDFVNHHMEVDVVDVDQGIVEKIVNDFQFQFQLLIVKNHQLVVEHNPDMDVFHYELLLDFQLILTYLQQTHV
jgi:hypothetical protein